MATTQERLRLLTRLFTRPTFAALSSPVEWTLVLAHMSRYVTAQPAEPQPLGLVFEKAWDELRKHHRTEYIYKNEVANRILFGRHSPHVAALHTELPIGRSIIDTAVFNGTSTAYEVKTEFDSSRRLKTQTRDYAKAFEKVFVVADPKFAGVYAQLVEVNVGVLALTRRGGLQVVKEARSDKTRFDSWTMFRCLRRQEYLKALFPLAPRLGDLPNGHIAVESWRIFQQLSTDDAHKMFVEALRRRNTNGSVPSFLQQLPQSLRALGCGTPLTKLQQGYTLERLRETVNYAFV